jgi:NAD(P)-dependent dehydrogenase (short-subunit alcohol dehydrogenase family)
VLGDLSDLGQTRDVAHQANGFGRFDAVIHNAGVLRPPQAVPVNTIAPYVLTVLMQKPGRPIYLSSSMHRGGSTDLKRLDSASASYWDSKLWVTALSQAFARRWPGTTSHAVDPGWVPTRMGGGGAPDDLTAGHETQVWLATQPDVAPATGGYWYHRRVQHPDPAALDVDFQAALIGALEDRAGIALD